MTIAENLTAVDARIAAACERVGRRRDEVRLLSVSKTHPASAIEEAYRAGCRRFGENRVQEAAAKAAELDDLDVSWSVIGHVQTNKVNQLVTFADEFQALDSLRLAELLQSRLEQHGRRLDVMLEVNTSGEASKFGVQPDEVLAFARSLRPLSELRVTGLMTIATNTTDIEEVGRCFDRLTTLREQLRQELGGGYDELSMGMSGDFELAIERGATCVRVGTAIFGARSPRELW